MAKTTFPFEDLSSPRLPGERWMDINGFKGRYQVSSHGRIRSVERKITKLNRWGQTRKSLKTGMVRKQKLRILQNYFTKTVNYDCWISLWKDNQEYMLRVARLVYEHFVGKIGKGKHVSHKDVEGRNNHYKNLLALDASAVRKHAHKMGRQPNITDTMTDAQKKKLYVKLGLTSRQPVQRISKSGQVIKNFSSIAEAAKDAPCSASYLTQVLRGRKLHVKGKHYRYKPGVPLRK